MKKAKKYLVMLFSIIFIIINTSGCAKLIDDLEELGKALEAITSFETSETTIETTTTKESTKTTLETIKEDSGKETVFVPNIRGTAEPQESTSLATEVTTDTTTETTDQREGLLKAESFTREDIIANGPLYDRRDQFDPQFIEDALEYFPEIAGGNEFDPLVPEVLNRWDTRIPIRIGTFGEPTSDDFARLDLIIPAVETLTGLEIQYAEAGSVDYNFEFHIAPLDDFDDIFEGYYVENNWGFVVHWHDEYGYNYYARMAVSNDYPDREGMNHLIMEEFIQALGLPNDSYRYEDSLFQQNWTTTQELMPIDWLLLEFVYRPELTPNMSVYECVDILREVYLN
ncbi:MAG: DUF2927 domain-containing protein [Clostridiaceae bacterium]|nr:DUF2927 domain-containing protein [Clostridiaceae bacterium]